MKTSPLPARRPHGQIRQLRKDKINKAKAMTSPQKRRKTPQDLGLTNVKKEVADMTPLDVAYGIKSLILRTAKSILAGTGAWRPERNSPGAHTSDGCH